MLLAARALLRAFSGTDYDAKHTTHGLADIGHAERISVSAAQRAAKRTSVRRPFSVSDRAAERRTLGAA